VIFIIKNLLALNDIDTFLAGKKLPERYWYCSGLNYIASVRYHFCSGTRPCKAFSQEI